MGEDVTARIDCPAPRRMTHRGTIKLLFGYRIWEFWPIFILLLLFSWFAFPPRSFGALAFSMQQNNRATGILAGIRQTGSVNRETVYRYSYTFEDTAGATHFGYSFGHDTSLRPGGSVTVEYISADPSTSRIVGFAMTPAGWKGAVAFLAPLLFLFFLFAISLPRIRVLKLIRQGRSTGGIVVDVAPSGYVHALWRAPFQYLAKVAFTDESGVKREFQQLTTLKDGNLTGKEVAILYNPSRVDHAIAVFPDAARDAVYVTKDNVVHVSGRGGIPYLICPVIALAMIASYMVLAIGVVI